MTQLLLLGVTIVAFFAAWLVMKSTPATLTVALATLTVLGYPTLTIVGAAGDLRTMAPPGITLYTFHVTLLLAVLTTVRAQMFKHVHWALVGLPLILFLVALAQRNLEIQVLSGLVQWCFVILAWGLGGAIAERRVTGELSERALVIVISAMVAVQALGVVLQLLGILEIDKSTVVDGEELSRISGLTRHPGSLGKILLLLAVMLFPLTRSSDRLVRQLSMGSLLVSTLLIALTLSRANTIAIIAALGLWLLFSGRGFSPKRLVPLVVVLLIALPSLETIIARQETDAQGGSRPILEATAWHQISQTLWWGVGPNNYLPTVGQYDRLAASGLPVHNAAVLALAELGAVPFALLALPILGLIVRALLALRSNNELVRNAALAIVASVPGQAIVIGTGHGIYIPDLLLLFMFVCGYSRTLTKLPHSQHEHPILSDGALTRPSSTQRQRQTV